MSSSRSEIVTITKLLHYYIITKFYVGFSPPLSDVILGYLISEVLNIKHFLPQVVLTLQYKCTLLRLSPHHPGGKSFGTLSFLVRAECVRQRNKVAIKLGIISLSSSLSPVIC
jgi:hypothetical protein